MSLSGCRRIGLILCSLTIVLVPCRGFGQNVPETPAPDTEPAMPHDHMHMNMNPGWQLMQDGVVFVELDHQGGARGGTDFVAPNWWMGMASRETARGRVTVTSMLSLDPATIGQSGYREIFQVGEALNGRPLVDRQHPHDLFMQLAAVWRVPLSSTTGFTLAGAPAGEPALGPVAFMHRASAADNPTAPLGHHTFDSTHVSFGVITAAVDHGRWLVEGSVFNGREPDEHRWDFDFGRLDSVSARIWFRPADGWELQASTGHLKDPEQLEPGNVERSTVSASWTGRRTGSDLASMTIGYGRNDTDRGSRSAVFVEAARRTGSQTWYARGEAVQVETALIEEDRVVEGLGAISTSRVAAVTLGGVRDVLTRGTIRGGFGADVTFYRVPGDLEAAYGDHPVSFHVFFRLRLPSGPMGPMWNMRMSQPLGGHQM